MSAITSSNAVIVRVADRLVESVGRQRYHMWFDQSARFNYDDQQHRLRVSVPNQFVADWIDKHFHQQLRDAAEQVVGNRIDLDVHVDADVFAATSEAASTPNAPEAPADRSPSIQSKVQPKFGSVLRHTLEEFIVGPSNELAFSAASSFAEEGPGSANILFVHGGCGLGKTHLLQGICRRVLDRRPQVRVHYTTAEQFTNEFLGAMRANRIDAFRRRIRRLDHLAVDDVHFLAGKQATQQEFLHSFDAIDLSGARVVLASDSHPKLIQKLSESLVSRWMRGMVVQIHSPNTATRIEIVRALAQRRSLSLLDGVIKMLAARCQGSVREIEGTLTKLHALARLANERCGGGGTGPIGHTLLNRLFEGEVSEQPAKIVRLGTVLDAVASRMHVTRSQMMSHVRDRRVVLARSLVIFILRQLTPMSFPEIAAAMGRSNHSSILNAARRIERNMRERATVNLPGCLEPVLLEDLVEGIKHAVQKH